MRLSFLKSRRTLLLLAFFIITFIAIPITVYLVRFRQNLNVNAASSVSATVNAAGSAVVSPGETINVSVTNTLSASSAWTYSGYTISQSSSGPYTCVDTPDYTTDGTYTESFDITAPTTPGVYNVTFVASDNSGDCNSGTQNLATLKSGIVVIVANPQLTQSCGIDIALVLDNSTSISSTQLSQMKSAVKTFVDSFSGTSTQFSVTRFASNATVIQALTSNFSDVDSAIDSVPQNGGYTNWEDGLIKSSATLTGSKPKFIFIATDGDPTASTAGPNNASQPNAHLAPAVAQANSIKTSGTRILAIGIGSSPTLLRLEAISGENVNTGDIGTSDVITANFSTLATQLVSLAQQACGGTLTVSKSINGVTAPDPSLADWHFDIGVQSAVTDSTGKTPAVSLPSGNYSVTEDTVNSPSGYAYDSTICSNQSEDISTTNISHGVSGVTVGDSDIVSCTVTNNQLIALAPPTSTPTQTPASTPTEAPTPIPTTATQTSTPTPTPIAGLVSASTQVPTVTPTQTVEQPSITLPPTGPSAQIIGIGIIGFLVIMGGLLLLLL